MSTDLMTKRMEELIKKGFLSGNSNLTKQGLEYQNQLLIKYEQVFRLIVLISNQMIRQSQLFDILSKTDYMKSSNTFNKMVQELELLQLIKRGKEEETNFKFIQVTKTAVKFVKGPSAALSKSTGVIGGTKNAVRVELFRKYFLKDGLSLKQALDFATKESVSTLFNSPTEFYESLTANDLAFNSFNSKSSNFFLQKTEIKFVKQQQRQSLDKNLQRNGFEKENKINSDYRRCWTLEKLALHQIYLVDSYLSDPVKNEENSWIENHFKDVPNFEPQTLHLKFALITISDSPNKSTLVKSLMHIHKYIYRTFKLHESYFIKKKKIQKAIVNVDVEIDVIILNDKSLKKLDCDDLLDWLGRKIKLRLRRSQLLESFKHQFNVNFFTANVNPNNEHLQDKKERKKKDNE